MRQRKTSGTGVTEGCWKARDLCINAWTGSAQTMAADTFSQALLPLCRRFMEVRPPVPKWENVILLLAISQNLRVAGKCADVGEVSGYRYGHALLKKCVAKFFSSGISNLI